MGLLAFLRVGVWMNGLRAFRGGFMGNVLGEGFVLGGVFVIGQGQQVKLPQPDFSLIHITYHVIIKLLVLIIPQGILLEHREIEFGDKVNKEDVIQAVRGISHELLPLEMK